MTNALGPGDVAGVVPAPNWNNAGTANAPTSAHTGANKAGTIADLIDSSGGLTGASLTWNANNCWSGVVSETDAGASLIKGLLDTTSSSTTEVTLEGIPYSAYDVYISREA